MQFEDSTTAQKPITVEGTCPHCGYCKHCGRGGDWRMPAPAIPMPRPWWDAPYHPYWQNPITSIGPNS